MPLGAMRRYAFLQEPEVPAAPTYDTDAANFFAIFASDPGTTYKGLVNDFVLGLKSDGLWALIDWWSDGEAPESLASRANLKNPAQVATVVGGMTFTANPPGGGTKGGWVSNGTDGCLDLGVTADSGANFSLNNAFVSCWCNEQLGGAGSKPLMGENNSPSPRVTINAHSGGGETFRINDATSEAATGSASSVTRTGHRCIVRVDSANKRMYKNGALDGTDTARASVSVATTNLMTHRQSTVFGTDRLCSWGFGGTLTAGQAAAFYARALTFFTARGCL